MTSAFWSLYGKTVPSVGHTCGWISLDQVMEVQGCFGGSQIGTCTLSLVSLGWGTAWKITPHPPPQSLLQPPLQSASQHTPQLTPQHAPQPPPHLSPQSHLLSYPIPTSSPTSFSTSSQCPMDSPHLYDVLYPSLFVVFSPFCELSDRGV